MTRLLLAASCAALALPAAALAQGWQGQNGAQTQGEQHHESRAPAPNSGGGHGWQGAPSVQRGQTFGGGHESAGAPQFRQWQNNGAPQVRSWQGQSGGLAPGYHGPGGVGVHPGFPGGGAPGYRPQTGQTQQYGVTRTPNWSHNYQTDGRDHRNGQTGPRTGAWDRNHGWNGGQTGPRTGTWAPNPGWNGGQNGYQGGGTWDRNHGYWNNNHQWSDNDWRREHNHRWGWNGRRYWGGDYYYPDGWGYQRWSIGQWLPFLFLNNNYFFTDYDELGIEPPPYGYEWVRYGPDLLLVDEYTGQIVDVEYGVFY